MQGDLPPELRLPKAPPLTPKQALEAFVVRDGYRVELAAAEPEIVDPVQIAFDTQGNLWAVEMRGFMPDPDGTNEFAEVGRIAVLRDTDGDGRFESRRDFLDGLVLPRGILPYQDGALVILPPKLVFARDSNGDGRADTKEVVLAKGFEAGFDNPEHAGNAPILGHDGWVYLANFNKRVRRKADGTWESSPILKRGQWGLSQDDWGRQFYNYNSSFLYGDRFSSHYAAQNRSVSFAGANERIVKDESVFPVRLNPGINRGYQKHMLKNGKLARTTAVCGPGVFRGGSLPDAWIGDVFVAEPAGNLVRHVRIQEEDSGKRTGENAWADREFLASKDERFRPVQCINGPDGDLYIVDLYRGILQHKRFLTTFLRRQIEARGLATPVGLGRIYRVVPDGKSAARKSASVGTLSKLELVAAFADKRGAYRDLAQKRLVTRGVAATETKVVAALRSALVHPGNAHVRYHAAWTMRHCGLLSSQDLAQLIKDEHPKLRALAIRLAESVASFDLKPVLQDQSPEVRTQLALSLSQSKDDGRLALLGELLEIYGDERTVRQAALLGLGGRELGFAKFLAGREEWQDSLDGGSALFRGIAQVITKRRDVDRVFEVLEFASACKPKWQREALVRGCTEGLPRGKALAGCLRAKAKTDVLSRLASSGVNEKRIAKMRQAIRWPGAAGAVAEMRPLTKAEERLVKLGKHYFKAHCVQCHQEDGRGQAGLAPSLHDSDVVLGPAKRQIRVVLHGLTGPVKIAGKTQTLTMEPLASKLNDRQIAAILTFTRRSWGHRAKPVSPAEVTRVRRKTAGRKAPWKREELFKIE